MAIIYSYPQGSSALQNDRVVITRIDEEENEITTKQITLGQIADYIIETSPVVTGTGTPNYIPAWGAGGGDLVDSIIYTTEGSINVGIVPSKGGGVPEDPYWIDKFQVQGTMSVSGNVAIGTPRQLENQGFDLNILGQEGKIAFGDNNIFGDPNIPTPITWNVVVGEYGTGDTDVLQLHGKEGTRFTRGALGETVSMSIDNKGYVGIGTDSPSSKLHVSDGNILLDTGQNIDFNYGGKVIGNYYLNFEANLASINVGDSGSVLTFKTSSSTAVTIDDEQNVGIGTTSPANKLDVVGISRFTHSSLTSYRGAIETVVNNTYPTWDIGWLHTRTSSDTYGSIARFNNQSGTAIGGIYYNGSSGTSFVTTSDYRLKENIKEISDSISRVKKLKPCRFNFAVEKNRFIDGFIAHEVQEVVPEAVHGEKDALQKDGSINAQTLEVSRLIPVLTKALQEAINKIEELELRIQTIENN